MTDPLDFTTTEPGAWDALDCHDAIEQALMEVQNSLAGLDGESRRLLRAALAMGQATLHECMPRS